MDALAAIEAEQQDEQEAIETLSDDGAVAFLESMPDPERELEAGEEPEALEAHAESAEDAGVPAEPIAPEEPIVPRVDRPLVRPEEI